MEFDKSLKKEINVFSFEAELQTNVTHPQNLYTVLLDDACNNALCSGRWLWGWSIVIFVVVVFFFGLAYFQFKLIRFSSSALQVFLPTQPSCQGAELTGK